MICDDDRSTAWDCYWHYRGIKAANEDVREKIVSLGFPNDQYFPALQAADMLAYLSRLEQLSNRPARARCCKIRLFRPQAVVDFDS
jgi:hypothetical protein